VIQHALSLAEAIEQFDRQSQVARKETAEQERHAIVERFPLDHGPTMTLEEYAIGQQESEDTFGRWIEFRTMTVASMRGGSARKHIIYKHKNKSRWNFPKAFENELDAWHEVRAGFLNALEKAQAGDWNTIDDVAVLAGYGTCAE
jgi:5-methylcytosine-specific restriction protein B